MVHLNALIHEGDNPDLTSERLKASFSTESLSETIYGGKQKLLRRREIVMYVDEHKELHDEKPVEFMTREERIENAARKVVAMRKHYYECVENEDPAETHYFQMLCTHLDGMPIGLHMGMFLPTLYTQTNDEQKEKWLAKAANLGMIGTYAQTEIGHGTNLRMLETTATFDRASDSFVLHSPTVSSTKWWPGNLGKSSNHAIVVAQLYIDKKCYGPHTFLVQLRDEETHRALPGITIGDIGPKFGINTIDNGFLRFDHFKIPRSNMMMGHSKVEADGTYVKPIHAKVGYGAMVYVRSVMTLMQGAFLAMAATIATRYSAIRRQGVINPGQGEVQVLDYQTQQHRLFPQIARAYAFYLTGKHIRDMYYDVVQNLSEGNADTLPELHAITSGLKSVVTHQVGLGIEQCRMACGGHGYSQASGIPLLYTVAIGGCTYEGENMVMLLQTARFLMRTAAAVRSGKRPATKGPSQFDYIFVAGPRQCRLGQAMTAGNCVPAMVECFEHVAKRLTLRAHERLELRKNEGRSKEDAWNDTAVDLTKASRAHTRVFIAKAFAKAVSDIADSAVSKAMTDLLHLYLSYEIVEIGTSLLEDGFMSGEQLASTQKAVYELLAKIRPNAVSLVDAFEFDDREHHSVLGRRDGHVYENLLKWAQHSELNKSDVLPAFTKYLGPMMKEARSKL
uniref:Acyl-coenzyme A oxidase n=1 Tax=Steinernema glaseri TaxID=37863 RepID=A0A1I7ZAB2_9BILA